MGIENKSLAVIIPAYNAEKTILAVYKNPSYVDWIIIVNDKSSDSTEKLSQ